MDRVDSSDSQQARVTRRRFGVAAAAATLAAAAQLGPVHGKSAKRKPKRDGGIKFQPFQVELPIAPVIEPLSVGAAPFQPGQVKHGIAPEFEQLSRWERFPTKYYALSMEPAVHQFMPGVNTPVWAYNGIVPGPTFKARFGEPAVVRFTNNLPVETSVHLHGGHLPAHADGFPTFYVTPGNSRDYFYPNTTPEVDGEPDSSEWPSTCWYHDHAEDITAHNAYQGLSGFYICVDELEDQLVGGNVLPREPYDVPLVLCDRKFNRDGSLFYDFLDHDGMLGDVFVANGKAQPFMTVERRKYRFRILNASNARVMGLQLSTKQPFLRIGNDSWLLPHAMVQRSCELYPANRAEIIVDFSNAPSELYLENFIEQKDGRGPSGVAKRPTPLIKFVVKGSAARNDATIAADVPLRPHVPIQANEIAVTREFRFERGNGAWQINGEFYDATRADAVPRLGSAERWILRNNSGGWVHPVHIHLESHQVQKINGRTPPPWLRYKSDCSQLAENSVIELFMKFRTFTGPFVFHCHNLEHEDMRMMANFEVREESAPAPTQIISKLS